MLNPLASSADHEDQDVVLFNRGLLPAYYGLLRLCCLQSRTFTRQLANHQNLHWAFKNITPHPTQYNAVSAFNSVLYITTYRGSKSLHTQDSQLPSHPIPCCVTSVVEHN